MSIGNPGFRGGIGGLRQQFQRPQFQPQFQQQMQQQPQQMQFNPQMQQQMLARQRAMQQWGSVPERTDVGSAIRPTTRLIDALPQQAMIAPQQITGFPAPRPYGGGPGFAKPLSPPPSAPSQAGGGAGGPPTSWKMSIEPMAGGGMIPGYHEGGNVGAHEHGGNEASDSAGGEVPRGVVNNNPHNLKDDGSQWKGWDKTSKDGDFIVFDDPAHGMRAGMRNHLTHFNRDGANTIDKLLDIASPRWDNEDFESYANMVARDLGVGRDEPIDLNDREVGGRFARSVANFELGIQGDPWGDAYEEGLDLAYGKNKASGGIISLARGGMIPGYHSGGSIGKHTHGPDTHLPEGYPGEAGGWQRSINTYSSGFGAPVADTVYFNPETGEESYLSLPGRERREKDFERAILSRDLRRRGVSDADYSREMTGDMFAPGAMEEKARLAREYRRAWPHSVPQESDISDRVGAEELIGEMVSDPKIPYEILSSSRGRRMLGEEFGEAVVDSVLAEQKPSYLRGEPTIRSSFGIRRPDLDDAEVPLWGDVAYRRRMRSLRPMNRASGGIIGLRGGGEVPMVLVDGEYIPAYFWGGLKKFAGKVGKAALKAAPVAAMFIPGIGPVAAGAIGGISGALSKKIEGGSWGDSLQSGIMTGMASAAGRKAVQGIHGGFTGRTAAEAAQKAARESGASVWEGKLAYRDALDKFAGETNLWGKAGSALEGLSGAGGALAAAAPFVGGMGQGGGGGGGGGVRGWSTVSGPAQRRGGDTTATPGGLGWSSKGMFSPSVEYDYRTTGAPKRRNAAAGGLYASRHFGGGRIPGYRFGGDVVAEEEYGWLEAPRGAAAWRKKPKKGKKGKKGKQKKIMGGKKLTKKDMEEMSRQHQAAYGGGAQTFNQGFNPRGGPGPAPIAPPVGSAIRDVVPETMSGMSGADRFAAYTGGYTPEYDRSTPRYDPKAAIPQLNPDSPRYDPDLVEEVEEARVEESQQRVEQTGTPEFDPSGDQWWDSGVKLPEHEYSSKVHDARLRDEKWQEQQRIEEGWEAEQTGGGPGGYQMTGEEHFAEEKEAQENMEATKAAADAATAANVIAQENWTPTPQPGPGDPNPNQAYWDGPQQPQQPQWPQRPQQPQWPQQPQQPQQQPPPIGSPFAGGFDPNAMPTTAAQFTEAGLPAAASMLDRINQAPVIEDYTTQRAEGGVIEESAGEDVIPNEIIDVVSKAVMNGDEETIMAFKDAVVPDIFSPQEFEVFMIDIESDVMSRQQGLPTGPPAGLPSGPPVGPPSGPPVGPPVGPPSGPPVGLPMQVGGLIPGNGDAMADDIITMADEGTADAQKIAITSGE